MFHSIISKILSVFMAIVSFVMCLTNPGGYKEAKKELLQKTDGYLCGVNHLIDYNLDACRLAMDANIGWERCYMPYPYEADGETLNQNYIKFKEKIKNMSEIGIKILAVTPYPCDFLYGGVDPRLPENTEKIKETVVFLCNDLKGFIGAIEVSNELNSPTFRYPLSSEQTIDFTGMQLQALNDVKGDIIVGYNTASLDLAYNEAMSKYSDYCDYVGINFYFINVGEEVGSSYQKQLIKLFNTVHKPIILTEFGYISDGEVKTDEQKAEILKQYGYESEEQARADDEAFVAKLTPQMQYTLKKESDDPSQWADIVFDKYAGHFYCSLFSGSKTAYPHTQQGQADFYSTLIPALFELDFVVGSFIFRFADWKSCPFCGQKECPYETNWGLCFSDCSPKLSYYEVREAYGKIDPVSK